MGSGTIRSQPWLRRMPPMHVDLGEYGVFLSEEVIRACIRGADGVSSRTVLIWLACMSFTRFCNYTWVDYTRSLSDRPISRLEL